MNFLSQFYTTLAARLLNIQDANSVSIIKHIDLWNQQYNDDFKEVFGHPAVFLEYKSIPFKTIGRHQQLATMQFDLHVASSTKAKSSYEAQFTDRFLQHLDLLDLINFWLTGWHGDFFGSLSRTAITHDHFYGDVIKHIISYQCTVNDVSAVHTYAKVMGDKLVVKI